MTTLTSRSLPLVSLQLNLTGNSAISAMHPMQRHNSLLPSDSLRISPKDDIRFNGGLVRHPFCENETRKSSEQPIDDMSDARSSSVSSYQADYHKEIDDDQRSYCSNDSELSVGKEGEDEQRFSGRTASGKQSIASDMESVDGSLSDRLERAPAFEESSSDTMRCSTSTFATTKEQINVIRPSPTRIQEELFRKSQMYAEELMRHQMNFMAATRGLNLSPKQIAEHSFGFPVRPDALSPRGDETKIGFRPHIRLNSDLEKKWSTIEDRSSHSPEATPFRGIHTHLNAISKITSALGRDFVHLTSTDSITSRESSQSPPGQYNQAINNNINETSLKFSIDNILKPGFGRRITDPLLKRNKTNRKSTQRLSTNNEKIPVDLSSTLTGSSTGPSSIGNDTTSQIQTQRSSSTATGKNSATSNNETESSNEKPPMVWPAWVYCTRYSDRPSSGKLFCFFIYVCISFILSQ